MEAGTVHCAGNTGASLRYSVSTHSICNRSVCLGEGRFRVSQRKSLEHLLDERRQGGGGAKANNYTLSTFFACEIPIMMMLIIIIMWRGETRSLNCGHQRAYCSSPIRRYMNMENHKGMTLTGEKSWSIHHRVLWKPYQQSHLVANQKELDEGVDEYNLLSISDHISKLHCKCRKTLRHVADDCTSLPKKGVLRFLSPLKIHCLGMVYPANLEFNDKHANHYTTEATWASASNFWRTFPILTNLLYIYIHI
jgi:hypothetical protein